MTSQTTLGSEPREGCGFWLLLVGLVVGFRISPTEKLVTFNRGSDNGQPRLNLGNPLPWKPPVAVDIGRDGPERRFGSGCVGNL